MTFCKLSLKCHILQILDIQYLLYPCVATCYIQRVNSQVHKYNKQVLTLNDKSTNKIQNKKVRVNIEEC